MGPLITTYAGISEIAPDWVASHCSEVNLLDVRFGPDGTGVGKLASDTNIRYDKETKMIEMEDYGKLPARLVDVRVEKSDAATTK